MYVQITPEGAGAELASHTTCTISPRIPEYQPMRARAEIWSANERRVLTCLGGGAGDGGPPPEQDAGRAAGQHGVTLGDGVTQVLTFRPLGNN